MQTKQMVGGYAVERLRALWSALCFFVAAFAGAMIVDATGGGTPPAPSGTEPTTNPSGTEPPAQTPVDPANSANTQQDWREAELKKAREEAAAYRVKLREIEAAQEKAKAEALAQQGEFKTLYEQEKAKTDAQAKRLEELEAIQASIAAKQEEARKVELLKLPEVLRPAFETATLEQIQAALSLQAAAVQQAAQTPAPNATSPAPNSSSTSDPQKPKSLFEMIQDGLGKK